VSGNVGIGSLSPTELLDVHGNVHIASDLTVDGNLTVTGTTTYVDTTNATIEDPIIELAKGNTSDTIDAGLIVTRGASNVAIAFRGDEEELAFGYTQSGASGTDVTPIANGGLDVRVYGNLFANNLTTTANVEATYLKGLNSQVSSRIYNPWLITETRLQIRFNLQMRPLRLSPIRTWVSGLMHRRQTFTSWATNT
jgi:hypothetical protein